MGRIKDIKTILHHFRLPAPLPIIKQDRDQGQHRINFNRKQVIYMKPDIEKIIQVMISLLEEQEKVKITYTIEKTA